MPNVVKKETKTYTKRSPDEPGVDIITEETTETMDDGSTMTTVKTTKKGAGLETFHKDTKKALEDSKHGSRRRSSSSSDEGHRGRHHRKHRSRSSSAEAKKKEKGGGLLAKLKKGTKSRSPSPKGKAKKEKETKSKPRRRSRSSSSSSEDESSFEDECIQAHNEYRKKHGIKKLEKNKKLTKTAKEWAKQLAKDDKMSHRKDNSDGENIYCKWSSNPKHKVKGAEAVDSWYSEIKDHDFAKEPSPGVLKSGHFSQVVWFSSKQVGVGKARSKSGRVYVVANYSPAGNFLGDYCDNVPPVGGFPAGHKPKRETTRVEKKSKHRSGSSDSSSSSDEEDFAEQCLKAHNEYRKKHGVSQLKLNKKLCKYSQEWAETIAKKDMMEHRSDKKYGENIFCVWSDDPKFRVKGKEAVESWYNEIKDHKFGCEPDAGVIKSGHFSQVIWKTSKELGVGKARSKSGKIMVVANYDPAGNFIGEFAKMVPKPQ